MHWRNGQDLADSGWCCRFVVALVELEAGLVHFAAVLLQVLKQEQVLLRQVVFVVIEMLADFVE